MAHVKAAPAAFARRVKALATKTPRRAPTPVDDPSPGATRYSDRTPAGTRCHGQPAARESSISPQRAWA